MKKKVFVVAVIVACIAILAAGTLAYFTGDAVTHNVITSDHVDIKLIEKTVNEDGEKIDWPHEDGGIKKVMPDATVVKEVSVQNVSSQPAYIRVTLSHTIKGADGKILPNTVNGVEMIQYDILNENGWIDGGDGYYYYSKVLNGNPDKTELLMKEVEFAPEMGNEYQNCTVELNVKAEAIQSKNNPIKDNDVKTAWLEYKQVEETPAA